MQVGDIVILLKNKENTPNKLGTAGIVIDDVGYTSVVCWFDNLNRIDNTEYEWYGNNCVSKVKDDYIKWIGYRDDAYEVGDNIVLLCPQSDGLSSYAKPFTVCKLISLTDHGCKIKVNGHEFCVRTKYIMKESQYLNYKHINNLSSNTLLDDIYMSLGE